MSRPSNGLVDASEQALAAAVAAVYKITIYADKRGEYRWRMKAPNGRIVADSGEGYKRRAGAEAAASRLLGADIVLVTGAAK